jgi:hypothetical protein
MQWPSSLSRYSIILSVVIVILCFILLIVPFYLEGSHAADSVPTVTSQEPTTVDPGIPVTSPELPAAGKFYISYGYKAETVYEDISINDARLLYTHFVDYSHRCEKWIQQSHCWRNQDLKTSVYPLSPGEVEEIRSTLHSSGFMELNDIYGGTGKFQSFNTIGITAADHGVERTVIYWGFPRVSPEPAAFVLVRDAVVELKNRKAGEPAVSAE